MLVVVDSATGKVVGGPEIHARGFLEDDSIFDDVVPRVSPLWRSSGRSGVGDTHQLQQIVAGWSASGSTKPTAAGR